MKTSKTLEDFKEEKFVVKVNGQGQELKRILSPLLAYSEETFILHEYISYYFGNNYGGTIAGDFNKVVDAEDFIRKVKEEMSSFKLEEVLKMLREDKTLEFEFDFYGGGRGGRIYLSSHEGDGYFANEVVMRSFEETVEPLLLNDFMMNTEYYLIEKGIKFKDMEEGKKYQRYDSDDGLIYGKVDGLLFLFNVDDYSSLEMHLIANMKFKEID